MSCLVTRPPTPEPCSDAMSTLCSLAMRRTSGDERARRTSSGSCASAPFPPAPPCCEARLQSRRSCGGAPTLSHAVRADVVAVRACDVRCRDRIANRRDDAVDGDRLAFPDPDFGQHAGGGRRNLGVHLVGGNLEQRLVAIDPVADLLDPANDGAFGNRLAHLRHQHRLGHRRHYRTHQGRGSQVAGSQGRRVSRSKARRTQSVSGPAVQRPWTVRL